MTLLCDLYEIKFLVGCLYLLILDWHLEMYCKKFHLTSKMLLRVHFPMSEIATVIICIHHVGILCVTLNAMIINLLSCKLFAVFWDYCLCHCNVYLSKIN